MAKSAQKSCWFRHSRTHPLSTVTSPAFAASSGDRFERAEHILNLYNPFLSSQSSPSSLLLFWGAQETQMWQSGTPYISSLGYIIP